MSLLARLMRGVRGAARTKEPRRHPAIEPMEPRQLLSAVARAPAWPAAPFSDEPTIIYVNQFGEASLPRETLAAGTTRNYRLYFDDPGTARVLTTGALRTQLALYDTEGRPQRVSAGSVRGGAAIAAQVNSKHVYHFAVRGRNGSVQGGYGVQVSGVDHAVVRSLPIRAKTAAGTFQTTISSPGDADFYQFTATKTGRWQVSVIPRAGLDAAMVIFNAGGNPLGGTFTQPVDGGGAGVAETWNSPKLIADRQYFIRVDGMNDSTGYYQVRARQMLTPAVSLRALTHTISEGGAPGRFIISRSNRSSLADTLRINYAIVGTAANGEDYSPLSGTAIIRAGRKSGRITIQALPDGLLERNETVGIVLQGGSGYALAGKRLASMVIADGDRATEIGRAHV